jgi:hypothetical protein
MAKLSDLGFLKGVIAETVVSTKSKEGKPNAAPMGVVKEDEEHLTIDFFNSSTTFHNILACKSAVINLTSNIEVFYKTAFKEANPDGKLPLEWFEKAKVVDAPKLRLAEVAVEISIDKMVSIGNAKTRAIFKVELIQSAPKYPQAHSRAMSQTLEAIIHATRVKALINDPKQQEKVKHLLEMIDDCHKVVDRVAPNSPYSIVMADLIRRIELWRHRP